MSKEHPARAAGPPGRPTLPLEAEQEIMDMLSANMRISSGEIAAILKKHGVSGGTDALQDSYRKRLGQRLMASIRDESGKREVLAHGSEYIVVEYCPNRKNFYICWDFFGSKLHLKANIYSVVMAEWKCYLSIMMDALIYAQVASFQITIRTFSGLLFYLPFPTMVDAQQVNISLESRNTLSHVKIVVILF